MKIEIEKLYRVDISYDLEDWDNYPNFEEIVKEFDCEIATNYGGGAACFPYIIIEGKTKKSVETSYRKCVKEIIELNGEIRND